MTVTQAAQSAGGCDLQLGHDVVGFDLADLRQRGEYLRDPGLADDIVGGGVGEDLGQGGVASFESVLEFGAGSPGRGCFLQRGGALLIGQLGKATGFLRLTMSVRIGVLI